ncbi:hypothetical protein JXA47_06325 [Candidatus Sumerlaeota bacterium]|nr:hypothetical protein [Candidatus Sumerlaeota bacterium]
MNARTIAGFICGLALIFGLGCGGGAGVDDGDGGKLLSGEEQMVKEWFVALAALGESMPDVDPTQADEAVRNQVRQIIDDMADLTPPRIRDAEANSAFQDFHAAMGRALDIMKDMLDNMPGPDASQQEMMAFMASMGEQMAAMQEIETAMRDSIGRVQAIVAVDFADDAEAQEQLRSMMSGFDL